MAVARGKVGEDPGVKLPEAIESMRQALAQWDEGIRTFEAQVRRTTNQDAETHLTLAKVYLERNRVDEALQELTSAVRLDPKAAEVHLHLGLAYSRVGTLQESFEAFRQAAALDPENLTASYFRAYYLLKMGPAEVAQKALKDFQTFQQIRLGKESDPKLAGRPLPFKRIEGPMELLQRVPLSAPVFLPSFYKEGFVLLLHEKYDEAFSSFRKAASADPYHTREKQSSERDRLDRIRRGLKEIKLEEAISELKAILQADPNHTQARTLLSRVYWMDGQQEKGIEELRSAIRSSPQDERLRITLAGVLISINKGDEAEQAFKEAIAAIPDSAQLHYDLGRFYYTYGRWQEALAETQRAAEFPVIRLDELYRRIGDIYANQVKLPEAIAAYQKALQLNPNHREARIALAERYFQRNHYDEALAEFFAVLAIDPQNPEMYASIAQVQFRAGRYADAVESAQRALRYHEQNERATYTLAQALMRLGSMDEGKKQIEKFQQIRSVAQAEEHQQRELAALKQGASASLERGNYDQAVALLRKAVEYEPLIGARYFSLAEALIKAKRYEEAIEPLQKALELRVDPEQIQKNLVEAYDALGRKAESEKARAAYTRAKQERLRKEFGER